MSVNVELKDSPPKKRGRPRKPKLPRTPAHVVRIKNLCDRLPELSDGLRTAFESLIGKLSVNDIEQLTDRLSLHVRLARTLAANDVDLSVGDRVKILTGNDRYVGQVATMKKVQHIRCYVQTDDGSELYLMLSDVEKV